MTFKTEMPRFDDPGMNRSNSDIMNFRTFQTEKIGDANRCFGGIIPVFTLIIGFMEANRFKPGVAFRYYTPLFEYFTFKPVCLRAIGSQCSIGTVNVCRNNFEHSLIIISENGKEANDGL